MSDDLITFPSSFVLSPCHSISFLEPVCPPPASRGPPDFRVLNMATPPVPVKAQAASRSRPPSNGAVA